MSQTTQRKSASDTIHSMYLSTVKAFYLIVLFSLLSGIIFISYKAYLYFTGNTWQEIGMDFLIIALPLIFGYSLYKQVKRVRSKQWVIHLILIIALSIMCKSETTLQWLTFAGRRRAVVRGNKIKSRGDVVGNINLLLFSSLF